MTLTAAVEAHLFRYESTPDLFNPYRDRDPDLDVESAPAIRKENLLRFLADHKSGASLLLVAEAPGPWGCRFSGVPITSEEQLVNPNFPASGRQSSSRNKPYSEYSANIFWRVLELYYESIFVWNTVPLHPHRPGEPLTIRTPRQSEINPFLPLLEAVVRDMDPNLILAVGRKAENALERIGLDPRYVRHPSQGGALRFADGVQKAISDLGLVPTESPGRIHG